MMENKDMLFQVPAYITKIQTMSKYLRMQIDTNETLSPESYKRLFELLDKPGWLSFNVHKIEFEDVIDLPPVKKREGKTKSERLRGVLYRLWQMDDINKTSDEFYDYYMESLIDKIKERLN